MTKNELEALEAEIDAEWVRRKRLGGYSADAEVMARICEWLSLIMAHLISEKVDDKE
jgi:hypothetical protein